ncbi:hypothetical protein NE575_19670, partial [Clostridium sp. SL.3.18]|nr:hypothetical protein [Clostridium sp. SL.3.18]
MATGCSKAQIIKQYDNVLQSIGEKSITKNTTLAFSETFTAVEQGTVDGLELPISSFHSTGYGEICNYLSLTGHFYSPYQMDVSSFVWENLTKEEQGWFEEA